MKKEEQKQHLIDMMRYDENLGLYKETEQMNVGGVSGSLPVSETIKEIENIMERWHLARDNDAETLQGINDALVKIGLLAWFNRQ